MSLKKGFFIAYLSKTFLLAGSATFVIYLLSLLFRLSISSELSKSVESISWTLIPFFGGVLIASLLYDVKAFGQFTPILQLNSNKLLLRTCFAIVFIPIPIFLVASYVVDPELDVVIGGFKYISIACLFSLVFVSQFFKQLWRVQHAVILSLCFLGLLLPIDILEFLIFHENGEKHLFHIICWFISVSGGLLIGFKLKENKKNSSFDENEDGYNRTLYVTRMTDKLCNHEGNIALIGGFGSGKTWIVDQVAQNLQDKKERWITVRIDGWGYQETAITQSIISHIIKEVSLHVDMTAYIDLPNCYRDALKGVGSIAGVLNSFIKSGLDPIEQFEEINELLDVLDLNLLVTVEDVDRNKNAEVLANEISSLLAQLRRYKHIRFIFSVGHEPHFYEMLMKSCGFYEFILSPCFSANKENLVKFRNELILINPDLFCGHDIEDYVDDFLDCCAALFDNPRLFNRFKDRSKESWTMLHGQVCIDDLLIFNTLMYCCPNAFKELLRDKSADDKFYDISTYFGSDSDKTKENVPKVDEEKSYKELAETRLVEFFTDSTKGLNNRNISPQSIRYQGDSDKHQIFNMLVQGDSLCQVRDEEYVNAISCKPEQLSDNDKTRVRSWLSSNDTFNKLAHFIGWQYKETPEQAAEWLKIVIALSSKNRDFGQREYSLISNVYRVIEDDFGWHYPELHAIMLNHLLHSYVGGFVEYFLQCGMEANYRKAEAIAKNVDFNVERLRATYTPNGLHKSDEIEGYISRLRTSLNTESESYGLYFEKYNELEQFFKSCSDSKLN